jgi:hypothetical protein
MSDPKQLNDQNDKNKNDNEEIDDILNQLSEKKKQKSESKETPKVEESKESEMPKEQPKETEDIASLIEEQPVEPSAPGSELVVEDVGVMQRITGIFLQPQKVFEYLRLKPEFLVPIVLVAIIGIITSYLIYDIAINETITNIEQNENIPDERRDMILDSVADRRTGMWRYLSIYLFPVIGTLVIFSVVSLVYWFMGNVILGGKASFKQIFSAFAYSYLILAIVGTIVKVPLMISKETIKIHTSLAAFMPQDASQSALFRFLDSFDIFTIWMLIVFGIGFATIYRFSKQKGMFGVFIPWLLYILIFNVALGSFFSQFTGQ